LYVTHGVSCTYYGPSFWYRSQARPVSYATMVPLMSNWNVLLFQEIFAWRYKTGQAEDESTAFVLPNHMMLKICTELPREMQVSSTWLSDNIAVSYHGEPLFQTVL
jgi:hypothetical protein